MSQLSDLTAAARADVVPGHILSVPRLREHGVAEDVFARWYIQRVERGTRKVPSELRQAMHVSAMRDVRDGYFTTGMEGFDAMAQSAKGVRLLFWLCLRVKHPQISSIKAGEMFDALPDESPVVRAVLDLWGYTRQASGEGASRPVEWKPLFDWLMAPKAKGGHDMTLDEAGDVTMAQLIALTGTGGERNVPTAYIRDRAKAAQYKVFARICEMKSLDRHRLGRTAPETVAAYVREITGDKPIDMELLKGSLAEYAKA